MTDFIDDMIKYDEQEGDMDFRMVCGNCYDYRKAEDGKETCDIRYLIHKDGTRENRPVAKNKRGCQVFLRRSDENLPRD